MLPNPPTIDRPSPSDPKPPGTVKGSFRLFRLAGTDVFLHWSWFAVAFFQIRGRPVPYSSLAWNVAEYVAGFGVVLLHEFGHVLACRQVGGSADQVVIWPLGGLAFVAPPPRAGANLWTTAAGPLVNVLLVPILFVLSMLTAPQGGAAFSDLHHLFFDLAWFNAALLIFNLLPIYPLDGGRILQALLWWWLGRATATAVVANMGIVAGVGLGILAFYLGDWWLGILTAFLMLGAFGGLSHAKLLARMADAPRRTEVACPNCHSSPPIGDFWRCTRCLAWLDSFPLYGAGQCPKGGSHTIRQACPECSRQVAPQEWIRTPAQRESTKIEPWYATELLRSEMKHAFPWLGEDAEASRPLMEQTVWELRAKERTEEVAFGLFSCDVWLACHGAPRPAAEAFALLPKVSSNQPARSLACWLMSLFPFPQEWNSIQDAENISAWILEHADRLSWSEEHGCFTLTAQEGA